MNCYFAGNQLGKRPSLAQILASSGGLAVVALFCAMSGFLFGANRPLVFRQDLPALGIILAYGFLIFPYFYSRFAALEGRVPTPQELSDSSRTFPLTLEACFLAIVTLAVIAFLPAAQWTLLTPLAIALLPFAHLGVRMYWYASRGDEGQKQERRFKSKILLPAFATCLVSFSLGYTLAHPVFPFISMWVPFALIAIGRELLSNRAWPWAVLFISLTILVASVALLAGNSNVGSVVLVGTILAFAMGVAEVCKRVIWIKQHHNVLGVLDSPDVEDEGFFDTGSNSSTAIFPLFLFLLPLLIPNLPVMPILLLVFIQYAAWIFWSGSRESTGLVVVNTIVGYLVPSVFVIQHYVYDASHPSLIGRIPLEELLEASIGFVVVYITFLLVLWHDKVRNFLAHIKERDTYTSLDNSFLLLLAISLVLFALTIGIALAKEAGAEYFQPKAKEVVVALLALWTAVTVTRLIFDGGTLNVFKSRSAPEKRERDLRDWSTVAVARLFFVVARLPVAVIAGLPVFVVILRHSEVSSAYAFLMSLPIVFTTMAGFVLNDIFDVQGDRNSTGYKALAAGDVSIRMAEYFALIFCSLAVCGAIISAHGNSAYIIFATLVGVLAYSPLAQRFPTTKGAITALLSCSPVAFAVTLTGAAMPASFLVLLFVFIFGRELLLDARDTSRDKAAGMSTLPLYIGELPTRVLGWTLMLACTFYVSSQLHGTSAALVLIALGCLIACLGLYVRNENKALAWSRIPVLLMVLGAALAI
jgi:4-hydroxybenzoate polyprenyltransferase